MMKPRRPSSCNAFSRPVAHTQGLTISMADLTDSKSAIARRNSQRRNSGVPDMDMAMGGGTASMERAEHRAESKNQTMAIPHGILSDAADKPKAKRRVSIGGADGKLVVEDHHWEKPRVSQKEGWQTRHSKVTDRVSSLFNSWTMSDVIFHVDLKQIPAHKFILAAASPVLFLELFSAQSPKVGSWNSKMRRKSYLDGSQGQQSNTSEVAGRRESGSHMRIIIEDYSIDAFFEFLRFVYTDDVRIDRKLVTPLVFMADDFKVTSLGDRCFEFIRTEISGDSVLTILEIIRTLLKKAVICLWKEVLEKDKVLKQFRGMSKAERRNKMNELIAATSTNQQGSLCMGSRAPSAAPSFYGGSRAPSQAGTSREGSEAGDDASDNKSVSATTFTNADDKSVAAHEDLGDDELAHKLMGGSNLGPLKKSHQLYHQLAHISEELQMKCWKCVGEHTDLAITCEAWISQPLKVVQTILRLEACNVPEIALFRAVIHWADNRCKSEGLPLLPEYRRKVLGAYTIDLIRFPLMTLSEIQWEVIPTGILEFKDLEVLLNVISKRSMMMGRFSAEPRHYPISNFLQHEQHGAAKCHKADIMQRYLKSSQTLATTMFDVDHTDGKLAPKVATYSHHEGDEIDAVLGQHLLRDHVNRFVDNFTNDLETAEAGVSSAEVQVTLALDPVEHDQSSYDQSSSVIEDDGGPHQQNSKRIITSMLMYTQSWMQQEHEEEEKEASAVDAIQNIVPPKEETAKYTQWGSVPEPQDFDRLVKGFYCFRGERILEMRMEQGETIVYEHTADDDGDDDFFGTDVSELKLCRDEEALRNELSIEKDELPDERVPLDVFMCRQ